MELEPSGERESLLFVWRCRRCPPWLLVGRTVRMREDLLLPERAGWEFLPDETSLLTVVALVPSLPGQQQQAYQQEQRMQRTSFTKHDLLYLSPQQQHHHHHQQEEESATTKEAVSCGVLHSREARRPHDHDKSSVPGSDGFVLSLLSQE